MDTKLLFTKWALNGISKKVSCSHIFYDHSLTFWTACKFFAEKKDREGSVKSMNVLFRAKLTIYDFIIPFIVEVTLILLVHDQILPLW